MAEIKDIYSLQFNAAEFEQQINASIAKIEELQGAMEGAAESTAELEDATAQLTDLLAQEAEGTDDLNQKRDVLVKTQKSLNKESKAYNVIGKEIDTTNGKIAKSTADATTKQKSFFGGILSGARSLNSLKRASGLLLGAFRLLGAFNPLGLLITGATVAVGLLGSLFGATEKAKSGLEKLNDPNISGVERAEILKQEIERLNELEQRVGSLTEEEKKQRDELTQKYQQTADEIVKIEEERLARIEELETSAARLRVKLLGDTAAAVEENFKVETEIIITNALKRQNANIIEVNKVLLQAQKARDEGQAAVASSLEKQADLLLRENEAITAELKLQKQLLGQERAKELDRIYKQTAEKRKQAEKEASDFISNLLEEERQMRERMQAELEGDALGLLANIEAASSFLPEVTRRTNAEILAENRAFLEEDLAIRQAQAERQTAIAALRIELERNQALAAAIGNAEQQEKINEEFNKRRAELDKQATIQILQERLSLLKALSAQALQLGVDTTEFDKEISDIELKVAELERPDLTPKVDPDPPKKKLEEILQAAQEVGNAIFDAVSDAYKRLIGRLDEAINRSKSALDEIRANSEQFNAQQLALEKDRFAKLEEERKRAVQREKAIAITRIAIDTAVSVAKAASQTGVGAPIAIAGVLAAIIGGVASAIGVAQGANFFEGSEYVDKDRRYPTGRDRVPAMLNRGERVITTDTNKKYFPVLSAIHHGDIPPGALNEFAREYLANGGRSVSFLKQAEGHPIFMPIPVNNSGLESRLERIENALLGLPGMMPRTTVMANARGIFTTIEQRRQRAETIRKISKS